MTQVKVSACAGGYNGGVEWTFWLEINMATKLMRKIVKIDEAKCNGCGLCIPNCAEGAIQIIYGKARLVGENLCDGLGACLGTCPQNAITIE